MSVAEETLKEQAREVSIQQTAPIVNRVLDFLSSVRFGVVLLCVLVLLSLIGMLIIQQNVNGFDAYFASLTPAEKTVYGSLGLFDIYHSWYFNFLLLVLSLNIVLASIDRFPSAWNFISKPKLDASRKWLLGQKQSATVEMRGENEEEIAGRVGAIFKQQGLKATISGKKGKLYIFGESGRWNRLGAYIVHVFLLTLFLGHFVALQTGFDADVRMMPGQTTNEIQLIEFNLDKQERFAVGLPFTINCTDIEQKLIDPKGSIEINNTLDWRTQVKIDDPQYGETVADVSLNKPFSYRGYRFFQASAITVGSARNMTLELTPQNGGETINVNLARNGSANLPDGTKIDYEAFFPDFVLAGGKPDTRSAEYNNPVVKLNITTPDSEKKSVYAFSAKMPDNIPIGAPVAGYKWRLGSFEKSPLAHVLSIKYDPFDAAFVAWYIGGFGLIGALCFVFFVSHKRIWATIDEKDENNFEVVLGGNTNRNEQGFEDKVKKIVEQLNQHRTY
ncbi:MAG: cytochrome c biogenesis protein ResB [Acidobacteria bacterium]|jgi:cytochrome c biogenesis protein|nr:cytochrome c biogenesis protein ResB [Acidobacteriota bacterium]